MTGRKFVNFVLIYTEERFAIIGVTSSRKDILGSYSLQGSGYSDQQIIKVVQALNQEIYILTSKDRLIKIKIDHSGNLFPSESAYKIPRQVHADKANEKIVTFCQYDIYFIFGINDGCLEFYYLNHHQ